MHKPVSVVGGLHESARLGVWESVRLRGRGSAAVTRMSLSGAVCVLSESHCVSNGQECEGDALN